MTYHLPKKSRPEINITTEVITIVASDNTDVS